jgi:hypothetical protein
MNLMSRELKEWTGAVHERGLGWSLAWRGVVIENWNCKRGLGQLLVWRGIAIRNWNCDGVPQPPSFPISNRRREGIRVPGRK